MTFENIHGQADGDDPDGREVAEERWNSFQERCHLEKRTGVSLEDQGLLEKISNSELHLICDQYRDGIHMNQIHKFIMFYYGIKANAKSLARYWRRTLPEFKKAENQRREFRTAERAMKSTMEI